MPKAISVGNGITRPGSTVAEGRTPRIDRPLVFYGSSITQGGCASRPGNNYMNHACRWLDADFINLGFSGSAKGELCVADYIASLELSAFVMDYDHNAKSVKQLKETHEKFFKTIRAAQPNLPIIVVSGPRDGSYEPYRQRRDIIKRTYDHAVAAGDKNVYFVLTNGQTITVPRVKSLDWHYV